MEKSNLDKENTWTLYLCSIYTFSFELDVKSLTILKQIRNDIGYGSLIYNSNTPTTIQLSMEKVIRLIPGSYQNGAWKELNGFFGSYYNEDT